MKNTMKRMLSGIMAMTMVCGATSISVFAADGTGQGLADAVANTFEADTGAVLMPKIEVDVPTSANITIDPFNISGQGQITSTTAKIVNTGDVPLKATLVDVTATTDDGSGVTIQSKALTDGSKWAVVNIAVTDGLKKTTSKVITGVAQNIAVSTAMAPCGGQVTFKFTGSCASNITADSSTDWADTDTIKTALAYSFTAESFTTYNITSIDFFSADAVDTSNITESSQLPATLSGNGGKVEVPVTWKDADGKFVPEVAKASDNASNATIYTLPDDLSAVTVAKATT